jgi:hypothetical protein
LGLRGRNSRKRRVTVYSARHGRRSTLCRRELAGLQSLFNRRRNMWRFGAVYTETNGDSNSTAEGPN